MLFAVALAHRTYNYKDITCVDGLYILDRRYCVTAEECELYGSGYHAYRDLNMCVNTTYQNTANMRYENHIYDCEDDYHLYFYYNHSFWVACLKAEEIGSDAYRVDGTSAYTSKGCCENYNHLNLFTMNNSGTLLCVTR